MSLNGYVANIELDEENGLFHGEVINTRDVLTFQGHNADELKAAFQDTLEDYFDWCKERGKEPEKPFSGHMSLRMPPELHRRVAAKAVAKHKSINGFILEALEYATKRNDIAA